MLRAEGLNKSHTFNDRRKRREILQIYVRLSMRPFSLRSVRLDRVSNDGYKSCRGLRIYSQALLWNSASCRRVFTRPENVKLLTTFTKWTKDARYYAKGVGFLSAFVSDPPQYIPVGELDTETRFLSQGGIAAKVHTYIHWRGISCRRLSRARAIRVYCTGVPRRGKRGTCLLYTSPSPRDKRQSRMPSSA